MAGTRMETRREAAPAHRPPAAAVRLAPVAAPPRAAAALVQQRVAAAAATALVIARAAPAVTRPAGPVQKGAPKAAPAAVKGVAPPREAPPMRETRGAGFVEKPAGSPAAARGGGGTAAAAAAAPAREQAAPAADAAVVGHATLAPLNAQVSARAAGQATHRGADHPVAAAVSAAVAPGPAAQLAATAAVVAGASEAQTVAVDTQRFKQALQAKLRELMQAGSEAKASAALDSSTAKAAGAAMKGELGQEKAKATGGLPQAAAAQPNPGQFPQPVPPPLQPEAAGPGPAAVDPGPAVPAPVANAKLDTSEDRNQVGATLAQAPVTQENLARSSDPSVSAAAQTQATAEKHGETGSRQVRAAEETARGGPHAQATGALKTGLAGMGLSRVGAFSQVGGKQAALKARQEKARQEIVVRLSAIQKTAADGVGKLLAEMEDEAGKRFDAGLQRALEAFETERSALEAQARRDQSWAGLLTGGLLGAIVGYFSSLGPEKVEQAVAGARLAYDKVVSQTIDDVAAYVAGKLAEARRLVARAKADADAEVAKLPADLRDVGREARAGVEGDFDKLTQSIDEKRDAVIDKLANAYVTAAKAVDARVQAFRDANKSLWDRAKEAVGGVIKTLLEFKALILGLLAKAAGVVEAILADPIKFLGNLVAGIKLGVQNFLGNILTHLKAGFFSWLFGAVAKAGITMPSSFGVKEIIGLILQILGLTYSNIRARAATLVGEPLVKALEAGAEIFKVLATEGPAGLWRMLLEKLESLKEQAIAQIKEMLITQVIKAGIFWLIGLLNPASGLAKACKAIYDIVMFLIERGSQIAELINAVLDGMAAVAAGNLTQMAKKVEDALAKAVPVAIGFLASLLGLGGLSEKIKAIVDKIQAPVNKAIDWLIGKAVSLVKTVGGAIAGAFKRKEQHPDDPEKEAKLQAGLKELSETPAAEAHGKPMSKPRAEAIAAGVKKRHPVFTSIEVVEDGDRWDFDYRASNGRVPGPRHGLTPEMIIRAKVMAYERLVETNKMFGAEKAEISAAIQKGEVIRPKDPDQILVGYGVGAREHLEDKKVLGDAQGPVTLKIELRGHTYSVRYTGGTNLYVYNLGTYPEIHGQITGLVKDRADLTEVVDVITNPGRGENPGRRKFFANKYAGLGRTMDLFRILREIAEIARSRTHLINTALNNTGQGLDAITVNQPVAEVKYASSAGRAELLAKASDELKNPPKAPPKSGTAAYDRYHALLDKEEVFLKERVKGDKNFPIASESDLVDYFVARVMAHLKANNG